MMFDALERFVTSQLHHGEVRKRKMCQRGGAPIIGLLAERGIRHAHLEVMARLVSQRIVRFERRLDLVVLGADTVEVEVHGAKAGDALHDVHAS